MSAESRIDHARLRQRIAAEVIELCRRITRRNPGAALQLHDAHARHSRQLERHDIADLAEERYDRELNRRVNGPR
jgi:hypothetical protein